MSLAKNPLFRCDGCGKETDDRYQWWTGQRHTHANDGFTRGDMLPTVTDFCWDCWRKMRESLRGKPVTENLSKESSKE